MSDKTCVNCKFYESISHRGQRYPKGKCLQHAAHRVSDGYEINLGLSLPYEYVCDLHEPAPKPVYALVDGKTFLVPPIVADDLKSQGWIEVKLEEEPDKKIFVKKE
jgi:hypothetical protein